ncbi:MAG: diaminopimelate epimerase [Thermoleophilaceae bacterium]|nr:diaminopimelate epimerase [Thermoleophilaceae bacterium]
MKFEKWQALGNDYIVVEQKDLPFELSQARVARLCAFHLGVGSDGLLLLSPSDDPQLVADVKIFNPDGSEAELSGNGVREAIMYLRRSGHTGLDEFAVSTVAGVIRPRIISNSECEVQMGTAATTSKDFPAGPTDGRGSVTVAGVEREFQHVSIGNPQCAIEIDGDAAELLALDLPAVGPALENDARFPNRSNVSFWQRSGEQQITARIFERGVGETLSSGTGATGAAVAAHLRGMPSPIKVQLDGGELTVAIDENLNITLTGWALPVFSGELTTEFISELEAL